MIGYSVLCQMNMTIWSSHTTVTIVQMIFRILILMKNGFRN